MALQRNKSGTSRLLSSTNHGCFEHDVFLSFRGEDTRNNFTGFFHYILKLNGIRAFFDEEDLPKGERIQVILEAITKSKILVPIFSQGYAQSKWCLREVAKMVECVGSGQESLIIPIFFDVDPRDVRRQTGPFKATFKQHVRKEKRDEVDRWRSALDRVGRISGYDLKDQYKGNQPQLVASIVDQIQKVVATKGLLHEEEYLVGVDARVEEIINRLDFEAEGVRIFGIHGIGGIGKTTLAKAIYDRSHDLFQASCFIENVREVAKSSKGLVKPQQQLVRDISKDPKRKIHNPSQGVKMIEDMVSRKRVLLILDDVDDEKQLNALGGNIRRFRFHSGSRVIITTRQERILEGLQAVYSLEELEENEALQLFNHHAFGADGPQEEYISLIKEVVSISKGLPLALQVFGALFKKATTREEWEGWVEGLRRHPHKDIHGKLRICYDSLEEKEKQIFLDIACLLVGKNSEEAIDVWEDLKLSPHLALRSLEDRSLIKINKGKFEMHDLIRDMGREVVSMENLLQPEKRSRLWDTRDIMTASTESQGNEIEGILLNVREGNEMELSTQGFDLMVQLRVLLINVSISNEDCDFMHFPAKLKWLEWKGCPLGELPLESKFKGILVLNLSHSLISQLWKQTSKASSSRPTKEMFKSLKVLDLSCCECLNAASNFAMAPNLKKLILDECSNLKEVDDSIAALKELVFLSMKGCVSLEKLPSTIYELSSLDVFNLEGCSNLVAFPQFPPTISTRGLFNLQELILRGCECLEFVPQLHQFRSLRRLDMDGCRSLDSTRDRLFEDDVAVREWDELSMSESQTPENRKEEFCFMLPCGSVNDPLLLKQLLCHSHDDPINNGTMILRVHYEDIANGDWVDSILEAHCDDSFGNDDIYCYTVQLPWDDKVSEASRRTSIKMKVRAASKHVLTKVDVKLQKRSKFSGENMKPFIIVSRKSRSARPELSIFIHPHEENKHDVIEYSRELDDRIDKLRRLDVRVREQRLLFGWRIEELVILSLILTDVKVSWYEQLPGTALPRQATQKVFDKMKVLNLSQCKFLEKTPDFAQTPHLETLILDHCECLEEIGESIRQLKKLIQLSIVGCTKLGTLPFAIWQLNSLLELNLSKCTQFVDILPEVRMTDVISDALCKLILDDCTSLRKLPGSFIRRLKSLRRLSLRGCCFLEQLPDSIQWLVALKELILDGCTSLRKLSICVGGLESLVWLSLRGCRSLQQLPDPIKRLVALKGLILDNCTSLRKLPECVGELESLRRLSLRGCHSLEQLPDSVGSLETLEELILDDCRLLGRLPDSIRNLKRLTKMQVADCPSLKSMPDLVNLTALEELNVAGCTDLIRIPSLQNLKSLKVLHMHRCCCLDLASVWSQLKKARWPHLEAFSISKQGDVYVDTMQIPFPPLHLESLSLHGRMGAADVLMIKVGEESVGNFEGPNVRFREDDEINKRLRVLATATGDDASPRFRTLTICCPQGIPLLQGADVWFGQSLMSGPEPDEGGQANTRSDGRANTRSKSVKRVWALFKSRIAR